MTSERHRVVVIGCGFGGLNVTRALSGVDPVRLADSPAAEAHRVAGDSWNAPGARDRRESDGHSTRRRDLLDATVVRALLVPALVAVFDRWNWWLPGGAARLLRVPAPLPPAEPAVARASAGLRDHDQQ